MRFNTAFSIAATAFALFTVPVAASAFIGGTVNTASVPPPNSPLQVRNRPRVSAPSLGFLLNGNPISLTGSCRQFRANGNLLRNINITTMTAAQAHAAIHQPRVWCQTMFEPSPNVPTLGWVNARFVDLI
jgi:hypothetical protein